MYLSIKQHDLFRNLVMGFEIPYRNYIADATVSHYTSASLLGELQNRQSTLSPNDPLFLRTTLPTAASASKVNTLYAKLQDVINNAGKAVIANEYDVPFIGNLHILTFSLQFLFSPILL